MKGEQRLTQEMKEGRAVQAKEHEYGVFTGWKWSKACRKECGVRRVAGAVGKDKTGKRMPLVNGS